MSLLYKNQVMDDDDEIIFVKEIRRAPAQNIFEKFAVGAFRSAVERLSLADGNNNDDEDCDTSVEIIDEVENDNHNVKDDQKKLKDDSLILLNSCSVDAEHGNIDIYKKEATANGMVMPSLNGLTFADRESERKFLESKKEKQRLNLKWPSRKNNVLKTPKSRKRRLDGQDHGIKTKKSKDNGVVSPGISSSPIARAFFSPSSRTNEKSSIKIGVTLPLYMGFNVRNQTSLPLKTFANCQVDLLDGLAEDRIFRGDYINTVLSFTSSSVVPPTHIVMYILTHVALSENQIWSRKAVNTLQNLMSTGALNHRNFAPTWDFAVSLATNLLAQIEQQLECPNKEVPTGLVAGDQPDILPVFEVLLSTFAQDSTRYKNNVRESLAWKLLTPSIFGNKRTKTVLDWLTKALQVCDETSSATCLGTRLRKFVALLQRLCNLMYQVCRNPLETADDLAQMYFGCFLDIGSLENRKRLLFTIEPAVVQRKTVEMIISTICESTAASRDIENQCISLDKITDFYFKKLPPSKGNVTSNCESGHRHIGEEVEEFVFMLYILCRSYLQENHDTAMKNIASLSMIPLPASTNGTPEFCLSLQDRETLLTLQEEIRKLKIRLESYTASLSNHTLLYLNMLSALFSSASAGNGLF